MEQNPKPHTTNKIKRALVYSATAILIAVCSFFIGFSAHYLTLDKELRSLMQLKERIQEQYYYEVDDEKFYKVLFDAVNQDILDEYSAYLTAEEYAAMQESAKGAQQGIGISFITKTADGKDQLLVSSVLGNSPAEQAGICAGERVLGYGDSEQELTASENFDTFKAFVDSKRTGDTLYLNVRARTGEERIVALVKSAYTENYVYYKTNTSSYGFTGNNAQTLTPRGEPLAVLPNDTAYVQLTRFNGAAAEEFSTALRQFKTDGKKNLVLDLRGNGGGYLDIMQKISAYFCKGATEKNPLAAVADFGEYKEYYKASGNFYADYFSADSRICVIADKNTASASECLLGVMLDYGAITYQDICLIERDGEARTYGKGIMQTTYPLIGFTGEAVKLTTAQIRWPKSDNCIHGRGVLPADGALTVAENGMGDEELIAAINALLSK